MPGCQRVRSRSAVSCRRWVCCRCCSSSPSHSTIIGDERFLTAQNLSIVAQQAAINTVLGAGMTFVILTGGIDLSVGSVLAASAMAALIASLIPDWGLLGIPAALFTGLFFGLINGSLVAFGKLPPFIVTLGSLTAVRGLARLMGSDTTVFNPDLPFAFIGNATIPLAPGVAIPVLAVIALLVIVVSWYVLRRTVLGIWIYAVGGNQAAARLSGIKVWRILLFVYAISGLLAGLGGVMSAARLFAANGLQLGPELRAGCDRGRHPGRDQLRRRHRLDLGHVDRGVDHCRAFQWADAGRRLRYLAIHRQGTGDHWRSRARPLPASRQRPDLIVRQDDLKRAAGFRPTAEDAIAIRAWEDVFDVQDIVAGWRGA